MSKPIIYGTDGSPAVRTVIITANAIGLDYTLKEVNTHQNEHKTEEFLKKNPQHTIPTLEDGGKYIWDSHAIATYLVSKYGKDDSFYPKDLYTRAMIDQRLHFESGVLGIKVHNFAMATREKNQDSIKKATEALQEAYDFLEKFLANGSYMVGNSPTVADFSMLATLSSINLMVPIDSTKFPKLADWLKRVSALPYCKSGNEPGLKKVSEFLAKMKAEMKA